MREIFALCALVCVLAVPASADPPSDDSIASAVDSALRDAGVDAGTFLEAKFYYIEKPKCPGISHDFIFAVLKTTGAGRMTRVYGLTEDSDGDYANGLAIKTKLPVSFANTVNFSTLRYTLIRAGIYQAFADDLLKNGLSKLVAYNAMLFAPLTGRPCANVARALRDVITRAIAQGASSATKFLYCKCSSSNGVISSPRYDAVHLESDGTLLVWGGEYPWSDDWVKAHYNKPCVGWKHEVLSSSQTNQFTVQSGVVSSCSENAPTYFKIKSDEGWTSKVVAPNLIECKASPSSCAATAATPTPTATVTAAPTARPTGTQLGAPMRSTPTVPSAGSRTP